MEQAVKSPKCNKCYYGAQVNIGDGKELMKACTYILATGHRRACPVDQCDKYEPKKRRNAKFIF